MHSGRGKHHFHLIRSGLALARPMLPALLAPPSGGGVGVLPLGGRCYKHGGVCCIHELMTSCTRAVRPCAPLPNPAQARVGACGTAAMRGRVGAEASARRRLDTHCGGAR
jgi:hypothetical protein